MGYNINCSGELKFLNEPTAKQIVKMNKLIERGNIEEGGEFDRLDIEIKEEFSGIEHDGSESTYDFAGEINYLITEMRKDFPDFGLVGEITVQGEEVGDLCTLVIENGLAVEKKAKKIGEEITCPHCHKEFKL